MATEKWIAGSGVGLTWTNTYTSAATFDSIVNGNAIRSDLDVVNGTNLDLFADFGISLGSAAFGTITNPYVGVFFYPLDMDGSTYGDGRFSSSAAGPPPPVYWVGNIGLVAATQAQTGTLRGVILPPGTGRFVLHNGSGVTWAGSGGNTIKYRTYNRQVT